MSNLEKLYDKDNYIMYRTTCKCTSKDHSMDLCLGSDFGYLTLSIYHNQYISIFLGNPLKKFLKRLILAVKILFLGYIETESEFIFRDEEHVVEFCDELTKSIIILKNANEYKKMDRLCL